MIKLALLALASLPAAAMAVQFADIQLWAGSGSQQAAVVIDFNDGQTPRSYVWGFRWNGTATGEQALRAIVAADPLLETQISVFSFGASLDRVDYLPLSSGGFRHSRAADFSPAVGTYWSYWTSVEGSNSWSFSSVGMSARQLTNGAVDGWAFSNPNYNAVAPTAPVAAVPEPATLTALAVGAAALLRRRRKA